MGSSKQQSLNWANTLKRANTLGIILFVGLLVMAGLLFLLLGVLGWQGTSVRALVALLLSPIVVGILFAIGWMVVRANKQPASTDSQTHHE